MSKKSFAGLILSIICLAPFLVNAASFGYFDPRSLGMGGTGVASANGGNAAYFNPALLSNDLRNNRFSLEVPIIGVRAADPENLSDALDAYQAGSYETAASNAISTFNTTPNNANALAAIGALQNLQTNINTLSNKALIFEANLGAVIGIPNNRLGIAVMTNQRAIGGAELNITAADNTTFTWYIEGIEFIRTAGTCSDPATPCADRTAFITSGAIDSLTSTVNVRGAVFEETGLSLATRLNLFGLPLAFGITPKSMTVTTFDYALGVQSATIDSKLGKRSYSDTNFDVGVATYLGRGLRVGAVLKNILEKSYTTVLGNVIEVKPQLRAGISHTTRWSTLAIDVDVTQNDPSGFEEATQYIAAGLEFNLFNLMQVRVGQRHNTIATSTAEQDITTFGLGLSPFGIHVDLAYAGSSKDQAVALQLGFKF
ncbi:MAG: conjugal transfer protein TraF [Gammaproteobacteria bacterium]|nr:conjugal transfer protein TraF [Gammaproteobacteria bacterium]MDH5650863.1 conjugal transfer protein TraF [Gammaproteobacteria bacterium]